LLPPLLVAPPEPLADEPPVLVSPPFPEEPPDSSPPDFPPVPSEGRSPPVGPQLPPNTLAATMLAERTNTSRAFMKLSYLVVKDSLSLPVA
jgi:hypothetical protein